MRPTVLTLLRNSRAALWAALVSLGLLQVAFAEHAHEHAVDEDTHESCQLCLKLSETKSSCADTGADSALPAPAENIEDTTRVSITITSARGTAIRAPPLV